ncbi:MAG TPA: BBP7 family outer membrane beta-barrel protein [Gemmataceae bacterium]|nr:BBP7 family outer membrane beta-barrel protein [Gemmataceae bacterium]
MRHVLLGCVIVLLARSGAAFAQTGNSSAPPGGDKQIVRPAEGLPTQPVPVAVPFNDPPPPSSPPPPPQPWFDTDIDGFATRFWLSADYLLWWTKGDRLPALATTGSPTDAMPGALGQPGTQVLFGGNINDEVRSGGRFRGGYWFTRDQTFGMDGTFFFLGSQSVDFGDISQGIPLLARPYYNVNSHREAAFPVAFPGQQSGSIIGAASSHLWGGDTNLRGMLCRGPSYQVSLLGGFRFLNLSDSLRMKEVDTFGSSGANGPALWTTVADHFHTSNQFYGGQIGTDVIWSRGRFFVDILGKLSLGTSVERTNINGWSSYATSGGQSGRIDAGQLALPSNIGSYGQSKFAVVPEIGVNLGYALTRHIRLTFGYTFLYWSSVFRVGDQIDRNLNPTEFNALVGNGSMTGPPRPNFTFKDTDFWAQGVNFGLQFRY